MKKLGFGLALRLTLVFVPFIFFVCLFAASIEYLFSNQSWKDIYVSRVKGFVGLILSGDFIIISLSAYYHLSEVILGLAAKINSARLKSLSFRIPTLYIELQEDLSNKDTYIGIFFISNWLIGVVTYIFLAIDVDNLFLAIAITQCIFMLGFYGTVLVRYREEGKWIFYQVRAFIMPYMLLLLPLFVAGSFIVFSFNWVRIEIFHLLKIPQALEGEWVIHHIPPWQGALQIMVRCLVWSSGISFILIWILPIIIRRDYLAIILCLLAIFSPIITEYIIRKTEYFSGVLVSLLSIPSPAMSLLMTLAVEEGYNFLKKLFTSGTNCIKCGNNIPESDNYCSVCGTPKPYTS